MENLQSIHKRETDTLQHQLSDTKQNLGRSNATHESTVSELTRDLTESRSQHAIDGAKMKEELR